MLLSLINLGSAVAFNIVTSLGTGALLSSYVISVGCILLKRLHGEPLLPRRWSLGRWGLPIIAISVLFMALCFIMSFFPQSPHDLTAKSFNWNIFILSHPCLGLSKLRMLMCYSMAALWDLQASITQQKAGTRTLDPWHTFVRTCERRKKDDVRLHQNFAYRPQHTLSTFGSERISRSAGFPLVHKSISLSYR